ncbi:MAG: ArsR/SmtB family transcription factor [Longimicrobiales bacterium]
MHRKQSTDPCGETIRVLGALSDENRFRIVELLARSDDLSCGAIGSALGLSPSLITHHLGVLESVGLIERRKNGFWTLNRLCRAKLSHHVEFLGALLETPDPATSQLARPD